MGESKLKPANGTFTGWYISFLEESGSSNCYMSFLAGACAIGLTRAFSGVGFLAELGSVNGAFSLTGVDRTIRLLFPGRSPWKVRSKCTEEFGNESCSGYFFSPSLE